MKIPDNIYYKQEGEEARDKNYKIMLAGLGITVCGVGVRLVGKANEREIKAELVKFQGSAMGVGLKIRF